jgi:hypothetical protein
LRQSISALSVMNLFCHGVRPCADHIRPSRPRSAWHVGTADGQLRGDKIAMNLPEADDEPEPSLHDRFPDGGGRPGGKPWTFSECSATAPDNIRRDGRLVECLQLERVHRFSLSDEMVGCLTSS